MIGDKCEIGPDTYIGPYTSIGNSCTIKNTELENSIIMENARIDTGNRITDSIIGRGVEIRQSRHNLPRSNKMISGGICPTHIITSNQKLQPLAEVKTVGLFLYNILLVIS